MCRDSLHECTCEGELHRRNLTPPDRTFKVFAGSAISSSDREVARQLTQGSATSYEAS